MRRAFSSIPDCENLFLRIARTSSIFTSLTLSSTIAWYSRSAISEAARDWSSFSSSVWISSPASSLDYKIAALTLREKYIGILIKALFGLVGVRGNWRRLKGIKYLGQNPSQSPSITSNLLRIREGLTEQGLTEVRKGEQKMAVTKQKVWNVPESGKWFPSVLNSIHNHQHTLK